MPKNKTNGNTALAKWDARLAEMAKSSRKAIAGVGGGGNFISCKGGHLSFQGQAIPGDKMRVIVVDWVLENQAYEGGYSEENPQSPYCFAFGRSKEEMAPNPEHVAEPVNATCDGCPNNQWGSAEKGRGKACAEVARLSLLREVCFEDVENAEEAYFKVPVTSMKYWAGYVRELEQTYNRPPLAFITEISTVSQAAQPGWHQDFKLIEAIEDAGQFEALMKLYDKLSAKIMFPYAKFDDVPAPTPAPRRAAPRVKVPVRPAAPKVTRTAIGSAAPVTSVRGGGRKGGVQTPKFV
jgi:hypothetical protein